MSIRYFLAIQRWHLTSILSSIIGHARFLFPARRWGSATIGFMGIDSRRQRDPTKGTAKVPETTTKLWRLIEISWIIKILKNWFVLFKELCRVPLRVCWQRERFQSLQTRLFWPEILKKIEMFNLTCIAFGSQSKDITSLIHISDVQCISYC